jgi:hypothetical protein
MPADSSTSLLSGPWPLLRAWGSAWMARFVARDAIALSAAPVMDDDSIDPDWRARRAALRARRTTELEAMRAEIDALLSRPPRPGDGRS